MFPAHYMFYLTQPTREIVKGGAVIFYRWGDQGSDKSENFSNYTRRGVVVEGVMGG